MVMLVDILEYKEKKSGALVTCALCDAYGKMWYFREKASLIAHGKIETLPAVGCIKGEVVSRYGDIIGLRTCRPDGVKSLECNDLFYVIDSQLRDW